MNEIYIVIYKNKGANYHNTYEQLQDFKENVLEILQNKDSRITDMLKIYTKTKRVATITLVYIDGQIYIKEGM